jgi:hypothetical protein
MENVITFSVELQPGKVEGCTVSKEEMVEQFKQYAYDFGVADPNTGDEFNIPVALREVTE